MVSRVSQEQRGGICNLRSLKLDSAASSASNFGNHVSFLEMIKYNSPLALSDIHCTHQHECTVAAPKPRTNLEEHASFARLNMQSSIQSSVGMVVTHGLMAILCHWLTNAILGRNGGFALYSIHMAYSY